MMKCFWNLRIEKTKSLFYFSNKCFFIQTLKIFKHFYVYVCPGPRREQRKSRSGSFSSSAVTQKNWWRFSVLAVERSASRFRSERFKTARGSQRDRSHPKVRTCVSAGMQLKAWMGGCSCCSGERLHGGLRSGVGGAATERVIVSFFWWWRTFRRKMNLQIEHFLIKLLWIQSRRKNAAWKRRICDVEIMLNGGGRGRGFSTQQPRPQLWSKHLLLCT